MMKSVISSDLAAVENAKLDARPVRLLGPCRSMVQVDRTRLSELLCQPQVQQISLIRAPAGFGKSTLMQQVYAQLESTGVTVAWMGLEDADNDASRFFYYLALAFKSISGGNWALVPGLPVGQLVMELLDYINQLRLPFCLFLDDLESIQNPIVLEFLQQIISHIPENGRMIMGSRSMPDLSLSRLRVKGALLEIDVSDLRFNLREVKQLFCEKNECTLSDDLLNKLHQKTEGWPAVLWLVSMLLEKTGDPEQLINNVSGTSTLITDYLAEEVLACQPQNIRDFLIRSSVFSKFNAGLCDAVLKISNSREILNGLEANNLFLVPVDGGREWFRYHGLFSVFLRGQLLRQQSPALPSLHQDAAAWYLAQQRPVPAIEQAIKSNNMAYALTLFSQHAQRLLGEGRALLLARLFASIDETYLDDWPGLQVVHVWVTSFTKGSSAAIQQLRRYEVTSSSEELSVNAMALKPMLISMLDRHDEAYDLAIKGMDKMAQVEPFAHAIFRTSLSYVAMVIGNFEQALAILDEGRRLNVVGLSPFTHIYAQSVEGVVELLQGRLCQAISRFRMIAGIQREQQRFATNGNAMAAILLAEGNYESGQLQECERLLKVYVPLMSQQCVPDWIICGRRNLARIHFLRGDFDQAMQEINELEYCGQRNGLHRLVACAHLERARFSVLQGDAVTAAEELRRAASLADWETLESWVLFGIDVEYLTLAQLRWDIHFASADLALAKLTVLRKKAKETKRGRRALKLQILEVLAYAKLNRNDDAFLTLSSIFSHLLVERSIQLLMDEGPAMIRVLKKYFEANGLVFGDCLWADPVELFRCAVKEIESKNQRKHLDTSVVPRCTNVEKLTKKELSTLALLAQGLSNNGIAARLFVSENTVRTHLRNINAKLKSQNRTEAVAIARRIGILS